MSNVLRTLRNNSINKRKPVPLLYKESTVRVDLCKKLYDDTIIDLSYTISVAKPVNMIKMYEHIENELGLDRSTWTISCRLETECIASPVDISTLIGDDFETVKSPVDIAALIG